MGVPDLGQLPAPGFGRRAEDRLHGGRVALRGGVVEDRQAVQVLASARLDSLDSLDSLTRSLTRSADVRHFVLHLIR